MFHEESHKLCGAEVGSISQKDVYIDFLVRHNKIVYKICRADDFVLKWYQLIRCLVISKAVVASGGGGGGGAGGGEGGAQPQHISIINSFKGHSTSDFRMPKKNLKKKNK